MDNKKVGGLPLITFHIGNPFYLKYALHHATFYNPDSIVYLLGDESNINLQTSSIKHRSIHNYETEAKRFRDIYKHFSSNTVQFLLPCFERWLIIKDLMEQEQIQDAFVFDSDLLLFTNVTQTLAPYLNCDFTFCEHYTPTATVVHLQSLKAFAAMLMQLYSTTSGIEKLSALYKAKCFNADGQRIALGGISDITTFEFFHKDVSSNNRIISDKPFDGGIFDTRVDDSLNGTFEMKKGWKKITWIDNLPYCYYKPEEKMIRLYSLHFPGNTKFIQHNYYIDNRGNHYSHTPLSILLPVWNALLKKGWNGMKNFTFYFRKIILKQKI